MATATATQEQEEVVQLQIDPSSPLSLSAPLPTALRDPRYAKFPPKVADWFNAQLTLTETHKRIAIAFADNFQNHSIAAANSKAKPKNAQDNGKATVPPPLPKVDDPASCTHLLEDLISQTYVSNYDVGTGEALTNLQCSKLLEADHEIIFVTGFLSPSSASVRSLRYTIGALATRQRLKNVRRGSDKILKVYVCFSSSGFLQKVLHTRSPKGRIWKPKEWKKLGLADPNHLAGAIDLTVKSLFFRPVGLLHGKYTIVDRRMLIVPSANLSWEEWLEGATTYLSWPTDTGDNVVKQFVRYWESVWRFGEPNGPESYETVWESFPVRAHEGGGGMIMDLPKGTSVDTMAWNGYAPAVFLPHPYQRSFPPIWPLGEVQGLWRVLRRLMGVVYTLAPENEATYLGNPQNSFVMAAIDNAEESIYLHTPNVTAQPIIEALIRAVKRGVVVEVVTSMEMMKWEQLVTAGTTTEKCLAKMALEVIKFREATPAHAITTGGLFIYQYNATKRPQLPPFVKHPENNHSLTWYDKSHVKCLIADEQVVMLGSGNADRASWVTSQEVNVGLFLNKAKAKLLRQALVDALAGRLNVFPGSTWVRGGEGLEELSSGVDGVPRKRMNDPEA
ncbi:hypothetical protein ABW21_db0208210 [Orbilia brochopaga]|nr:hypothetical protein ABW21_db0208210 [Drechslerella brochopaga]